VDLIQTKVSYVVQEAIVVIKVWAANANTRRVFLWGFVASNKYVFPYSLEKKTKPHPQDIFRRYPNEYESVISILCENLEDLNEPEAKASMIWIIGHVFFLGKQCTNFPNTKSTNKK
jgi:hypothetical protein